MEQHPWHLGQTSERYETGGRGPGSISHTPGDPGGASYGLSQFSLNTGSLREYLNSSRYKDHFNGLKPGSAEFDAAWRELAQVNPTGFARDQHEFTKIRFYDVQDARLKARGMDLSHRGPAVQDALWSTAVQFRNLTPAIFEGGIKAKFGNNYVLAQLSDKDIIEAVQDYKIEHNDHLFKRSGARVKASVLERAREEKRDLQDLASGRHVNPAHQDTPRALEPGTSGHPVRVLQSDLAKLGYTSSDGTPLRTDGIFGPQTRNAVEAFQRDHGLATDSIVGPHTRRVLDASLEAVRNLMPNVSPTAMRGFSDPGHPQYAMYAELKALLPARTSEARLAQATTACHLAGLDDPKDLGQIYKTGNRLLFTNNSLFGQMAELDLVAPAPSVQQSVLRVLQHDTAQPSLEYPTYIDPLQQVRHR